MKKFPLILLSLVLCLGACAPVYGPQPAYGPQPVVTGGYVVAVGDRPYYTRGPYYIHQGRRYVWIRGHWGRRHGDRVWIHGHYVLRG